MDDAEWFTPCDAKDGGAIPMAWRVVPPEKLKEPPLMPRDFFAVLKHAKVSVGSEEIKKYYEWTKQYGLEGA
jgi:vacuolar protein-sorting-associated protein 4